ncbi:DUF7941 domain-family protein, partial [Pseudomonas aeruginosa]|uniref:DUF7941 domain-family protein n=1 Tax=Pseudomonas aeruginosa TaxID=287 RepID=UPI001CA5B944
PYSSLKVVEKLSELNNIVFDVDDFEHTEYDVFNQEFILHANRKSLRFVGFLRVRLINTLRKELPTFSKVEFPDVGKPDNVKANDLSLINGTYYITGYDFSEHREYLRHLTKAGTHPDPKKMAAILAEVTNKPWTASKTPASHNIAYTEEIGVLKYRIIYNGIVLPRFSGRTDIQNVLVIELHKTLCQDV